MCLKLRKNSHNSIILVHTKYINIINDWLEVQD